MFNALVVKSPPQASCAANLENWQNFNNIVIFCWVIFLLISDVDPNQHGEFGRFLYEFPMILAFFALRIHIIDMNLDPGGQNYTDPIHIITSDID